MPAAHDLDPDAMTDEERRAKRRYDAYFAFETAPPSRVAEFNKGTTDHTNRDEILGI